MSTTTETRGFVGRLAVRAARFLGAATLVVATWFCGLAAATVLAEPTRGVVVFGPHDTTFRAVMAGTTSLVDAGTGYVVASGHRAGFVRELYAAGAWLVLPATGGGCRRRTPASQS
jgi:hypothetical protein